MKKVIVLVMILSWAGCNVTEPDSEIQRIAQDANQAIQISNDVLDVVPVPSPLKETLLGVLAIAGAAVGAIQGMKKKRADVTVGQIVRGIDDAVKSGAIVKTKEFTAAMNASQDSTTRKAVDDLQK